MRKIANLKKGEKIQKVVVLPRRVIKSSIRESNTRCYFIK